jgi:hypothetical protein
VVKRYKKNLDYYFLTLNSVHGDQWHKAVKELEPVVKAIEEFLEMTDDA